MPAKTVDGRPTYGPGENYKTGSTAKNERQAALIEWLLTPEVERKPKTRKAFAEKYGVTVVTLRNDMKEPMFQRELMNRGGEVNRVDRLPDVMDALYRQATGKEETTPSSRVSAAKVWLDQVSKNVSTAEGKDFSEMTTGELEEAVFKMFKSISDLKKADGAS